MTPHDWVRSIIKNNLGPLSSAALCAALGIALTGCGKQAFTVTTVTSSQQGPGHYFIAPKIDIVMFEDDTGSMIDAYSYLKDQTPKFLDNLQSKGWNYHFTVSPLTRDRALTQAMASKHDYNWGSNWLSPYPGAVRTRDGSLSAGVFRTAPPNFTGFLSNTVSDINNSLNGKEPGLQNIQTFLNTQIKPESGFMRPDAMLAIVVVGNGEDTSGVNYCNRPIDGLSVYCEDGSWETSEQNYRDSYLAIKPNHPEQVRFFAAVADKKKNNCQGGGSYQGTRYQWMAGELGGASFDICSQPLTDVLEGISSQLDFQKLSYRTRFLFISQDANPSTIKVTKYSADSGTATELANDPENGWTYAGSVSSVYAIDFPIPMNLTSGYAIELHGSAKLVGSDTADISFKPAGAVDAK